MKITKINRKKLKNESGVALIPVLCLIFTGSLLVMMALMYSQMNSFIITPHTEMQKSVYRAEGVSNRVYWLTLISASKSGRNPDFLSYDYANAEEEYFFADGRTHQLDYYGYPMEFTLQPQDQGVNLSFSAYRDTLRKLRYRSSLDTEYCDLIDRLTDLLTDYYDNNDTIENNGAEATEYELAGMEPLPRNSPILWREELLFIPEIRQLFPLDSDGRLTAVSLVSLPQYNRNPLPSIFTATPEILKRFGNLEDDEVVALYQAIQNYKNNGSSIADQLDADLLSKVRTYFFSPSFSTNINYISAVIRPSSAGTDSESHKEAVRYPARRLAFTFAINSISKPILHYPEWQLF